MNLPAVNDPWIFLAGKVRVVNVRVRKPRWWEWLLFWRTRKWRATYEFEVLP